MQISNRKAFKKRSLPEATCNSYRILITIGFPIFLRNTDRLRLCSVYQSTTPWTSGEESTIFLRLQGKWDSITIVTILIPLLMSMMVVVLERSGNQLVTYSSLDHEAICTSLVSQKPVAFIIFILHRI